MTEKKKEFLPFVTAWMELETIMLSEINTAVKEKHHMISPISGTSLIKQMIQKGPETGK